MDQLLFCRGKRVVNPEVFRAHDAKAAADLETAADARGAELINGHLVAVVVTEVNAVSGAAAVDVGCADIISDDGVVIARAQGAESDAGKTLAASRVSHPYVSQRCGACDLEEAGTTNPENVEAITTFSDQYVSASRILQEGCDAGWGVANCMKAETGVALSQDASARIGETSGTCACISGAGSHDAIRGAGSSVAPDGGIATEAKAEV